MIQSLPIDVLRKMTADEQDKLVRQVANVEKIAKDATSAHKLSFPAAGKIAAAIQERLSDLLTLGKIATTTTLSGYWESITRSNGKPGQKLNNHVYSCAVAFGTYVRSELITESDYDKNPGANLELAASISTQVGGDVTHAAVMAAAEELRDRSKSSAKNLQDILDTVKEPKQMTVEQAQKALDKILAGGHLNVVIAAVGAEIAHVKESETARSAYFGLLTANEMFAANVDEKGNRRFTDDVINAWGDTYDKLQKAPEMPAETPAPEAPVAQKPAKAAKKAATETPVPTPQAAPVAAAA